ncbi:MAG: PEP-CTERM sorting domain-containing protein [Methylibium sp.]|uniref:PEP-CTERM sorting domain-containing protein n=1 Tax=Methylibium sp. TaxID=2067992 RepID=UPI00185C272C|nr:PEP-CTERM sorting domain-containing protein [Methylibium sp.]MBA3597020.1 PEP-CTERM sorting domain-containing protein [Methylibium sp.]
MTKRFARPLALAAVLLSIGSAANALSVIASPSGTGTNLVNNACNFGTTDTGNSVTGCLNNDQNQVVTLSSDESLTYEAGGQAFIAGTDSPYSRLSIAVEGQVIDLLVLNINASEDGFVSFSDGLDTSSLFSLDANGQNFFTITGPFQTLSYTTFSDQIGTESDIVADTRQVRFELGDATAPIPEPGTYALMLAGLGAMGFMVRRRKKQ